MSDHLPATASSTPLSTATVRPVAAVPPPVVPDPALTQARVEIDRLRRDVHDQLGSLAAATVTQLQACLATVDQDPARGREHAELALREAQVLVDRARMLASRHPCDGGRRPAPRLRDALTGMTERMNRIRDSRPAVALRLRGDLESLPAPVAVAVFWIAREALTNVLRHSDAEHAWVSVEVEPDAVHLRVIDDGSVTAELPAAGEGLESMVCRARELGGACTTRPGARGGFRVAADLPLTARVRVTTDDEETA